jgi:hypothetical protein
MHTITTDDDLFHRIPVTSRSVLVWKENVYINAYDDEAGFACLHHFSMEPASRKGYFNAVYNFGNETEHYSNRFEMPNKLKEKQSRISDGKLTFEVVEPLNSLRVSFKGEKFSSVLDYTGRFGVFDYRNCPLSEGYSPLFELGRMALPYCHQEQGLFVKGTVTVKNPKPKLSKKLSINGVANRDHSWGLRNEQVFDWYDWTGVHFQNWFSNWCLISDKLCEPPEKHGGFISTKDGNISVKHIEVKEKPERVVDLKKLEAVEYFVEYLDGTAKTFLFDAKNAIGPAFFPNVPVEKDVILDIADWWGKWKVKETGEVGKGLNEMGRLRKSAKSDIYAR